MSVLPLLTEQTNRSSPTSRTIGQCIISRTQTFHLSTTAIANTLRSVVTEMCTARNYTTRSRHDRSIPCRTESSYVHGNPRLHNQLDTYTTVHPCILHRCNRSRHCDCTSLDRNWHRCKDQHRHTARQHRCQQAGSFHGSRTHLVGWHIVLERRGVTCKKLSFVRSTGATIGSSKACQTRAGGCRFIACPTVETRQSIRTTSGYVKSDRNSCTSSTFVHLLPEQSFPLACPGH